MDLNGYLCRKTIFTNWLGLLLATITMHDSQRKVVVNKTFENHALLIFEAQHKNRPDMPKNSHFVDLFLMLSMLLSGIVYTETNAQTININEAGLYLNGKLISPSTPITDITEILDEKPRKSRTESGKSIFTYDKQGIAITMRNNSEGIYVINVNFDTDESGSRKGEKYFPKKAFNGEVIILGQTYHKADKINMNCFGFYIGNIKVWDHDVFCKCLEIVYEESTKSLMEELKQQMLKCPGWQLAPVANRMLDSFYYHTFFKEVRLADTAKLYSYYEEYNKIKIKGRYTETINEIYDSIVLETNNFDALINMRTKAKSSAFRQKAIEKFKENISKSLENKDLNYCTNYLAKYPNDGDHNYVLELVKKYLERNPSSTTILPELACGVKITKVERINRYTKKLLTVSSNPFQDGFHNAEGKASLMEVQALSHPDSLFIIFSCDISTFDGFKYVKPNPKFYVANNSGDKIPIVQVEYEPLPFLNLPEVHGAGKYQIIYSIHKSNKFVASSFFVNDHLISKITPPKN